MQYPEHLIVPMREDLTKHGVQEARTAAEVDRLLAPGSGTVLMIVNSVCGCAAGKARPGVGMALQNAIKPDTTATVFAGGDIEAVNRVREILKDYPASSPSMALFQDGKPVYMLHRFQIEQSDPLTISKHLTAAFDQFCQPQTANR